MTDLNTQKIAYMRKIRDELEDYAFLDEEGVGEVAILLCELSGYLSYMSDAFGIAIRLEMEEFLNSFEQKYTIQKCTKTKEYVSWYLKERE